VRNIVGVYSALSELSRFLHVVQGRRASLRFGACPWLLYFAPLALRAQKISAVRYCWRTPAAPSSIAQVVHEGTGGREGMLVESLGGEGFANLVYVFETLEYRAIVVEKIDQTRDLVNTNAL
jgi:hypothetical protein